MIGYCRSLQQRDTGMPFEFVKCVSKFTRHVAADRVLPPPLPPPPSPAAQLNKLESFKTTWVETRFDAAPPERKSLKSWELPLKMKRSLQGFWGKKKKKKEPCVRFFSLPPDVEPPRWCSREPQHFNISLRLATSFCAKAAGGAVFSALAEFILFYYLSYLSLISSSAHKPQVWEGRLLWKAGETWRGFLRYSLQREEQVSGACRPHRVVSGARASPCTRQKSHPCMQAQSCKWRDWSLNGDMWHITAAR